MVLPRTHSHAKNIEERRYTERRKSFNIIKSNCVRVDIQNLSGMLNDSVKA
jgi:hypothetical protein